MMENSTQAEHIDLVAVAQSQGKWGSLIVRGRKVRGSVVRTQGIWCVSAAARISWETRGERDVGVWHSLAKPRWERTFPSCSKTAYVGGGGVKIQN